MEVRIDVTQPREQGGHGRELEDPPTATPVASARTAGTFPEAMAASVATTTTAARTSMTEGCTRTPPQTSIPVHHIRHRRALIQEMREADAERAARLPESDGP
jgi:hypothetical protein